MVNHRSCCYFGCKNYSSKAKTVVHLYTFPADDDRRRIWAQRTGNPEIMHAALNSLDKKFLCEMHFDKKMFHGPRRDKLIPTSVPQPYVSDSISPSAENEENVSPSGMVVALAPLANGSPDSSALPLEEDKEASPVHTSQSIIVTSAEDLNSGETIAHNKGDSTPATAMAARCRNQTVDVLASSVPTTPEIILNVPKRSASTCEVPHAALHEESGLISADMTPKEKKLHSMAKCLARKVGKLKNNVQGLQKLLNNKGIWKKLEQLTSPGLSLISKNEAANLKRKPHRMRCSAEYKALALAVYIKGLRPYRYLQTLMTLPSEQSIIKWLSQIPLEVGINPSMLAHLQSKVAKQSALYKKCSLIFDEVALQGGLHYNHVEGKIEGLEDLGNGRRTSQVANRAIVFMAQSALGKWKQPLCFYLVKDSCSAPVLAELVKEVIGALDDIGLEVVSTVCDQSPSNLAAVKELRKTCEEGQSENVFKFRGKLISCIFDMAHILKGIRNSFITSNIVTPAGLAKWEHLEAAFAEDEGSYKMLRKVTPADLHPQGKEKVQLSRAARVLSRAFHAYLGTLVYMSEGRILPDAKPTVDVLLQINQGFDLCNGPSGPDDEKHLRRKVSASSVHHEEWPKLRRTLSSWCFQREAGIRAGQIHRPPSLVSWEHNIVQFQRLWKQLHDRKAKYMHLRQFSQDSLENFLQSCGCDVKPTANEFAAAFKTVVVSGLASGGYRDALLSDLRCFLVDTVKRDSSASVAPVHPVNRELQTGDLRCADRRLRQATYVCGFVVKRVIERVKGVSYCRICLANLQAEESLSDHTFSKMKNFDHMKFLLTYPTLSALTAFNNCRQNFLSTWLRHQFQADLKDRVKSSCLVADDFEWLSCPRHKNIVKEVLIDNFSKMLVKTQVKKLNKKINIRYKSVKRVSVQDIKPIPLNYDLDNIYEDA